MDENERSTAARLGIAALNLLLPGLGWFRLGNARAGLSWLGLLVCEWIAVWIVYAARMLDGFHAYATFLAVMIVATLLLYLVPIVASWRGSAMIANERPWWSRWYAIVGFTALSMAMSFVVPDVLHRYYKTYYAPAESMAPAIARNDRFLADMRRGQPVERGGVYLFDGPGGLRVYRVAGLPGDHVAVARGVPIINGQRAAQHVDRTITYDGFDGPMPVRLIEETLPRERGAHRILDSGYVPEVDDMADMVVPAGRLFVLGDNREMSADSRVSIDRHGLGLPSLDSLRGRPLFLYWSDDRTRIGRRIE